MAKNVHTVEPPFVFVGSGSSGTHLLGVLLDKHPQLACGPELGILNKRICFENYNHVRANFSDYLSTGMPSGTLANHRTFFRSHEAYGWSENELLELARSSTSFYQLLNRFFDRFLKRRGAQQWGEKTLSNVYCIDKIKTLYPDAKFIHLVRDGRDVVGSKHNRGAPVHRAASQWFLDVSTALVHQEDPNVLQVQYESLVERPSDVLREVCQHLGVEYVDAILDGTANAFWAKLRSEFHDSWAQVPDGSRVSKASVGSFESRLSERDLEIFWNITRLGPPFALQPLPYTTSRELMTVLGYPVPEDGKFESAPIGVLLEHFADWLSNAYSRLRVGDVVFSPQTGFDVGWSR